MMYREKCERKKKIRICLKSFISGMRSELKVDKWIGEYFYRSQRGKDSFADGEMKGNGIFP